MKRKYKLDEGGQKYVEQSTLLEPNNFVPSWEGGEEEKNEVSQTLGKLRKKYDEVHKMVAKREGELEKIKKEMDQVGHEEIMVEAEQMR